MGKDLFFLSISIDAEIDRPDVLAIYREVNQVNDLPGWLHLTGTYAEIEQLRRTLGAYDLDPVVDADKTQHAGIVTFGNGNTDWWIALPAEMDAKEMTETIRRITNPRRSRLPLRRARPAG